MYKTHIKQWRLDKNNKEIDMKAIVRKRTERLNQGKSSIIRVRGKIIHYGDVVRYWDRRRVPIEAIVAQRAAAKTPEAVEFSTPIPSRVATPEVLLIPERLLGSIRDYFAGSFESRTWLSANPQFSCETTKVQDGVSSHLKAFQAQSRLACDLLARHCNQEAGQTLLSATDAIKSIVFEENPATLGVLFTLCINTLRCGRFEITLAILRRFANQGRLLLGEGHLLRLICGWLALLDSSEFTNVLHICLRRIVDAFETLVGPMHRSSLDSRLMVARENNTEQTVVELQELLSTGERNLGFHDIRTMNVRLSLAFCCYQRGDYVGAEKLGQDITNYTLHAQPQHFSRLHTHGLYILARSRYALRQTHSAWINLSQAINIRISIYGVNDAEARRWLLLLNDWSVEHGYCSSAAGEQNRMVATLEPRVATQDIYQV